MTDLKTPLGYAQAAVMWDDRRADIVPVLVRDFDLTDAQANEVVTAAQQGFLMQIEAANPEAWRQLGLTSQL